MICINLFLKIVQNLQKKKPPPRNFIKKTTATHVLSCEF